MHPRDTLVFRPIGPLVPRPVRLPVGALLLTGGGLALALLLAGLALVGHITDFEVGHITDFDASRGAPSSSWGHV